MADIVLSPLIELVLGKLISIAGQEISLVRGADQELHKLSSTLSTIRDVLGDAEEKQVTETAVRNWLKKLKDVAYDAEDILDEYATEALRFKVEEGRSHNHHPSGQVCNFSFFSPCFCINRVKFRNNIGHKIKEIRERIDEINKERSDFRLEERPISERRLRVESSRETGSNVNESAVIGRDADKERIRDLLLSSNYNDGSVGGCCVIPIVGLGGLGKTTLAQCVFNEKRVQEHFELKMWVCVSTDFEVKRLIKEIIGKASGGEACDLSDLDGLQRRLKEKLTGKRYLLVLDDVWNEEHERWENLRDLLVCGGSGSKIIVTTRSKQVSSIMQTIDPIHLEGLSEEDCWTLFARRAFKEGEEGMYPKLVEIGKQIVGKCRGVPLAVKTLGGLMDLKREEREWLAVLQSGMLDIPEDKNGILNALRLSYNYLPYYLKPCFALCSIFPQDYRINKNELIRIWMAQGYIIQPSNQSKQMEDVGSDYFKFLLHRCFFQEVEEDKYGSIESCKMHDLFHDLAQSVAGDECRMLENGRSMAIIPNKVLHLSLTDDSTVQPPYECDRLRTILQPRRKRLNVEECLFVKFKCLRILDLSYSRITVLPNSIGNLKHLRYLDISSNDFKTLPSSICTLWNLQTLNITECENLSELPKDIKSMINLRHLEIDNRNKLSFMPVDIGKLTCLQTLPIFHVGKGGASIRELGCLKSLRGELAIYNLENVNKNMEDAKEDVLKDKEDLYSLELYWERGVNDVSGQHEVHEGVLESLKPHTNLKSLLIEGFNGAEFPKWVSDSSFTNLVEVKLIHCNSCHHLPPFGQLQSLKRIHIRVTSWVKSINDDFYGVGNVKGFPSLESLHLETFPNLEEWSTNDRQADMCCLINLTIGYCPKLRALPNLPSLQELSIVGEGKITSSRQGLEHLTTLKTLMISCCYDIALTLEHHPSLETLKIMDCGHLTSIHNGLFQNLFNLTSLEISSCEELKPLPETMQNLTALRNLTIKESSNFASSPHAFKHLSTLKSLSIEWCGELECLPEELRYLTALDSLRIVWCKKLGCLPEGLKHLTSLQDLYISECPLLVERCERGGEDWHKISHIPNIKIR